MTRFNILRFKQMGRMPKLMLAAGVLALALLAGGGVTAKKADAATGTYTLEVSYEFLNFSDISDGLANNRAELYGTIGASTKESPIRERMIGTYRNPGICGTDWTGSGQCYKRVDEGVTYFFSQTPMCNAHITELYCTSSYATNNNKFRLAVSADPSSTTKNVLVGIRFGLDDYDSGSSDDPMCYTSTTLSFSGSQIPTLDQSLDFQDSAHDGNCTVRIRVRRV